MGDNENVDTTSFRQAVWNYIHCIYGIRQDDYDYRYRAILYLTTLPLMTSSLYICALYSLFMQLYIYIIFYSEVNQLLEKPLKSYIKTVTCYPERITKKDYDSFMCEFKHSEKVQRNLLFQYSAIITFSFNIEFFSMIFFVTRVCR